MGRGCDGVYPLVRGGIYSREPQNVSTETRGLDCFVYIWELGITVHVIIFRGSYTSCVLLLAQHGGLYSIGSVAQHMRLHSKNNET